MSTQPATRIEALPFPTTPAEIWEAYEVDILAAKATLPRTWRDWLHLPLTHAAWIAVLDAFMDRRDGAPIPYRLWCIAGALVSGRWADAQDEAGMICERSSALFHLYLHVSRALAPLGELVRDLAWACSPDPCIRYIGRALVKGEARLAARRVYRAFKREHARHRLAWRWQVFCTADPPVQAVALAALLWLALAVCWALLTARH